MKRTSLILIILIVFFSCKSENKKNNLNEEGKKEVYNDTLYTIEDSYDIGDVRRYGVMPNQGIGQHPKLLKDKMEVLLDIAEFGIELKFPKGVYDRTFNIDNRKNIKIISDSALFTGAINIKNSKNITMKGVVQSLSKFYTRDTEEIDVNTIITKTDTVLKKNNLRSTGVEIHSGSHKVNIKKMVIKDLGSGPDNYKYIKAGLIVHGHNNEPTEIKLDSVVIESSDRHGAYLTGEDVDIKYLNIKNFGIGDGENMAKMEGGIEGEQTDFAGLWIKNCHNSFIDEVIIDINNSKGKYIFNFDIGEEFKPTVIESITITGDKPKATLEKRIFSRTGVKYLKVKENGKNERKL
ncbi:hypothetical protein [Winogradskyella sp.]|uniref:hypothetical protein n=1 Tax=Winogradskyella sp. TaxID=1883156 RepID=UPI00262FA2C0|nr:hypothetical protein [uncultured Winogradskyella sp.]